MLCLLWYHAHHIFSVCLLIICKLLYEASKLINISQYPLIPIESYWCQCLQKDQTLPWLPWSSCNSLIAFQLPSRNMRLPVERSQHCLSEGEKTKHDQVNSMLLVLRLFQNVPSMWTVAGPVSRASPFLNMSNIREVDAMQVHAHQILPNRSWEPQSSRLEFVMLVLCITLWMDFWGFLEAKVKFKRSTQSYAWVTLVVQPKQLRSPESHLPGQCNRTRSAVITPNLAREMCSRQSRTTTAVEPRNLLHSVAR